LFQFVCVLFKDQALLDHEAYCTNYADFLKMPMEEIGDLIGDEYQIKWPSQSTLSWGLIL